MKKKTKIPQKIADEVMFKSDMKCCVCENEGDHIHHLNGKDSDNRIDNLAFLCFKHHNLATVTGGLRKKLSAGTIIKYRLHLYEKVDKKRKSELKSLDKRLSVLTEEKIIEASKTAVIILEIEKLKRIYFDVKTNAEEHKALEAFFTYSEHANHRVSYEIYSFISRISTTTRSGMDFELALQIDNLITSYMPSQTLINNKPNNQLAEMAIGIGSNIAYDALIYLDDFDVALSGMTIMKYVYRIANYGKNKAIMAKVNEAFVELADHMVRPERNDLIHAQELVALFRSELTDWDLSFPPLPEHLYAHRGNAKRKRHKE